MWVIAKTHKCCYAASIFHFSISHIALEAPVPLYWIAFHTGLLSIPDCLNPIRYENIGSLRCFAPLIPALGTRNTLHRAPLWRPCHKLNAGNLWQSHTQIQYCNYKEKAKEVTFIWTDAEIELLLEAVKVFAATCLFELGKDWEGVKAKYDKIKEIFIM